MDPDSEPAPERAKTDAALRAERENADRALAAERAAVNADVDRVVHLARDDADARVQAARDQADQTLDELESIEELAETVAELREVEDEALASERATVDEILRIEREHARALSELLPIERDRTDRHLHTERSRSDAAVAHRDDFLGMVSHDLRNLLGGILFSAELLARQVAQESGGAKTLANVERIRRYSARMNRLIGDLVDVTSIDAGKFAVAPSPGDPAAVISEALDLFRAGATTGQVTIASHVAPGTLPALFDRDRLVQVLANLISNAIKFTPPGGDIAITGERRGAEIHLAVRDSGPGIPQHLLERIFERFWQVGEHDHRGLGLGLYISRCIIAAHGGRIWAESVLGEYSKISFTLPAA